MKKHLGFCLLAALLLGPLAHVVDAIAADKVPAGHVAWQLVGSSLINPATGTAQVLAYFTFIEGVPGPMFADAPGERTAFFTLRSKPFTLQTFSNGDILIGLLGTETFSLFLNTTPNRDFSNPDSFSDGQLMADLQQACGSTDLRRPCRR